MTKAMKQPPARVIAHRVVGILGVPGLAGTGMLLTSALLGLHAMHVETEIAGKRLATLSAASKAGSLEVTAPRREDTGATGGEPGLHPLSEAGDALTRLSDAARRHGLAWTQAEYRFTPASARLPAQLEVQVTSNATYRQVRSLITEVSSSLHDVSIKELTLRRATSNSDGLEVHFGFVIYLSQQPAVKGGAS